MGTLRIVLGIAAAIVVIAVAFTIVSFIAALFIKVLSLVILAVLAYFVFLVARSVLFGSKKEAES